MERTALLLTAFMVSWAQSRRDRRTGPLPLGNHVKSLDQADESVRFHQ